VGPVLVGGFDQAKKDRDTRVSLVFHRNGEPLNRKTVGVAYNTALKRLGITHVSGTHMLRKTTATQANRVTGDFYAVSKMLDHSDPSITLKYVEEVSDQKRKVADALDSVANAALGISPRDPNGPKSSNKVRDDEHPVPQCPTPALGQKLVLIKSAC
jgi:hypothetical protein